MSRANLKSTLGAEVYTVALEPFVSHPSESAQVSQVAQECHLQMDLHRPDAADILRFMFGKDFDLVTAAHLDTARGPSIDSIAYPLLKQDGGVAYSICECLLITHPALVGD